MKELVEPHVGQAGNQRDAVGDLSTRPTCSATGASDVARTRLLASSSQPLRSANALVTAELLADAFEIRAPTVADDGILALDFDTGDHGRIAAKRQRRIEADAFLRAL